MHHVSFWYFRLLVIAVTECSAMKGCKDILMTENKDCFDGYKTYLANLGNSGADSSQILSLLCRDEGRAATNCLKPLLNECKELADDDLYQVFTVIDTMGGCEQPESPETMGGVNGEMSNDGTEVVDEVDHDIVNDTTLFTKLQEESVQVFRCYTCVGDACGDPFDKSQALQISCNGTCMKETKNDHVQRHCIEFPFDEECNKVQGTEICFCSTDLCNGSDKRIISLISVIMSVLAFVLMK